MSEDSTTLFVDPQDQEKRLDLFLTEKFPEYSRNYFQKLIEKNLVTINGKIVKKRMLPQVGDEIEVQFIFNDQIELAAENIPLEILHEDENLLAINKPAGMVVHPAPGNPSGTFVNGLLYHLKKKPTKDPLRPGIVHRLDKDTSGILLAAKNTKTQTKLVELFATRKIEKIYLGVAGGHAKSKTIEKPIRRNQKFRQKMCVSEDGKKAVTIIENLQNLNDLCCLKIQILTGRTHQIRVHLQSDHHPILGDKVYGNQSINQKHKAKRQLLHAYQLDFIHPMTKKKLQLKAPLMEDMQPYFRDLDFS